MSNTHPRYAAVLVGAVLGLAGCGGQVAADTPAEVSAKVEPIAGTGVSKVILTSEAAAYLGLKTAPVRPAPPGEAGVVSYSAVLYDAKGAAWVFTSPAARSFVRTPIVVDRVQGSDAYFRTGPKVGTIVVTVGVPELYGAENGVGGE
jgi:hypothetical protein